MLRGLKSDNFCLLLLEVPHSIIQGSLQASEDAPPNWGTQPVLSQTCLMLQLHKTPQRETATRTRTESREGLCKCPSALRPT